MHTGSNHLLQYAKKFWNNLIEKSYMEMIFLNLSIFSLFFFNVFYYPLCVFLFLVIMGVKFVKRTYTNTLFSYQLIRFNRYPNFVVMGILNTICFILILAFGGFFIEDIEGYFLLFFLVMRLVLACERSYVQRVLTIEVINSSLYNEDVDIPQPLVGKYLQRVMDVMNEFEERDEALIEERMRNEKLKTDLITNISHDLKTPLTSIVNYADILSKKTELDDEAREYISVLKRNSARLKSLIVDMIFASRTGNKDIHVEKSFIEFNELILQIYGDFDQLFKKKNLDLVYQSSQEEIMIYTDGNLMVRVIENLLSNAQKYSKEGTRIYVNVTEDSEEAIFEIKNVSKDPLNISVDELYSQLVKVDKSRHTEGSGLGLYIVRNLVEALDGTLEILIDGDYFKVILHLKQGVEL